MTLLISNTEYLFIIEYWKHCQVNFPTNFTKLSIESRHFNRVATVYIIIIQFMDFLFFIKEVHKKNYLRNSTDWYFILNYEFFYTECPKKQFQAEASELLFQQSSSSAGKSCSRGTRYTPMFHDFLVIKLFIFVNFRLVAYQSMWLENMGHMIGLTKINTYLNN